MLKELAVKATSEGIIHCTFPNKDCIKAYLQKEKWHMVRPFGHLHYFSKQSILTAFSKAGWGIVKIKKTRIAENTTFSLIKHFDFSQNNIIYKIIKSLIVGQIILGKDQWVIIAKRNIKLK